MKVTIPFTYSETVVPKRCRKPRSIRLQGKTTVTIHEITAAEAPVAIRQHEHGWDGEQDKTSEYRWWRGKLWLPLSIQRYSHGPRETQSAEQFASDPYPYHLTVRLRPASAAFDPGLPEWDSNGSRSLRQRRTGFRQWASNVLFIDGQRYEQVKEPRYVIMTFGLGGNHGIGWGTSLSTDNHYNSNIGKTRYFRCDQYAQAEAAATRIATNRGDTKALPISDQKPDTFEILIPEAVRLNPNREHGDGDPFINSIETMIEGVKNPLIAGLGAIGLLSKEMARAA